MKIPEQLKNSKRSMLFRDRTPLYGGYRLIDSKTLEDILDVRLYWGKGSTCRCITWLHDRRRGGHTIFHGTGIAGGYGYDKPSQAVQGAFNDLGIMLNEYCCGCRGDEATEEAIKAVGKYLGHKKTHLIHFHR